MSSGSFTYTLTRERLVAKPESELLADVLAETPDMEEYEIELEVEYSISGSHRRATREDPEEWPELEVTTVTLAGTTEEFKLTPSEEDKLHDKACEHSSENARDYKAEKADYLYDQWKDEGRHR